MKTNRPDKTPFSKRVDLLHALGDLEYNAFQAALYDAVSRMTPEQFKDIYDKAHGTRAGFNRAIEAYYNKQAKL